MLSTINFELSNEKLFQELINNEDYNASVILVKFDPTIHWYTYISPETPSWVLNLYYQHSHLILNLNVNENSRWMEEFISINYKYVDQLEFNNVFDHSLIVRALQNPNSKCWYSMINSKEKANQIIISLLNSCNNTGIVIAIILELKLYEPSLDVLMKIVESGIPLVRSLVTNKGYMSYFNNDDLFTHLIQEVRLYDEFVCVYHGCFITHNQKVNILTKLIEPDKILINEKKITYFLAKAIEYDNVQVVDLFKTFLTSSLRQYICECGHLDLIVAYKDRLLTRKNILLVCGGGHFESLKVMLDSLKLNVNDNSYTISAIDRPLTKGSLLLNATYIEDPIVRSQIIKYLDCKVNLATISGLLLKKSFRCVNILLEEGIGPEPSELVELWTDDFDEEVMNYLLDNKIYPNYPTIHKKMDQKKVWIRCYELGLCDNCCLLPSAIKTTNLYQKLSIDYGSYRQNELIRGLRGLCYNKVCVDTDDVVDIDTNKFFFENISLSAKYKKEQKIFKIIKSIYNKPHEAYYVLQLFFDATMLRHLFSFRNAIDLILRSHEREDIKNNIFKIENIFQRPSVLESIIKNVEGCCFPSSDTYWKHFVTTSSPLKNKILRSCNINHNWLLNMVVKFDDNLLFDMLYQFNPELITKDIKQLAFDNKSKKILKIIVDMM